MEINSISSLMGNFLLGELTKTSADLLKIQERLATGRRINSASDDAAGLAIATRLESQARALGVAERNAQMAISKLQTAEGSLGSVTQDVQRIRELSVQAANGTLSDADRQAVQEEINQLVENVDYTLQSAEFNSRKIFSGETETYQIGTDSSATMRVEYPSMSAESLGLNAIDVSTQAGAEAAIAASSDAMDRLLEVRTELGASQNRLESALETMSRTRIDTLSTLSTIRDANMAEETINQAKAVTSLESQLLLLNQVKNLDRGLITSLLKDNG